jgi:dienelactone hydrolase
VEKQIVIESPDGTFGAYISRPATLPAPVVVVLQELFGVNADIRVATRWQPRDTSRSRQTSSGGRSLTLILT